MKQLTALFLACVLFALTGCGGGGSGGSGGSGVVTPPPPPDPTTFSVEVLAAGEGSVAVEAELLLVRDPAFPGGPGLIGPDPEILGIGTVRNGSTFEFPIPSSGVDAAYVVARSVRDDRFAVGEQAEFGAAVGVFDILAGETVQVTPLTTLALLSTDDRSTLAQTAALEAVLARFGATDPASINPSVPVLFAFSMADFFPEFPSALALDQGDPRDLLATLDVGALPAAFQEEAGLRRDIAIGAFNLAEDATVVDLATAAGVLEFQVRAEAILAQAGESFAPASVAALAEAAVQANAGRSIGRNDASGNVLRYLLNAYQLEGALDAPVPDPTLQAIAADGAIPQIVASGEAISVSVPLLPAELLGGDEALRADYYYRSELSPLTFVPRVVADISDVLVADEVQKDLVVANAEAGRFEVAEFLAGTQIFQSALQADALRLLGQRRGEVFQQLPEGEAHLDEALDLYEALVDTKGLANFDGDDALFYLGLIRNYLALGLPDKAQTARSTPEAFVAAFGQGEYSTALGRLFTAYWRLAEGQVEAALAAGLADPDLNADAEAAVDDLAALARDTNAFQTSSSSLCSEFRSDPSDPIFPVRGLYIQRALSFYADLGLADKAVAVAEQDLPLVRANEYQRCRTDAYIDDIVGALVTLGEVDLADELLASMLLDSQIPRAESARGRAFAFIELEQGNITAAIDAVLQNITGTNRPRDVMQDLLYFNTFRPGLARVLIQEGRLAEAKQVLDFARAYYLDTEFVDYASSRSASQIVNTFLDSTGNRLAQLYNDAGFFDDRDLVLADLEGVASTYLTATAERRVAAQMGLANAYRFAGRFPSAVERLRNARDIALGLEAPARADWLRQIANRAVGPANDPPESALREFDLALEYLGEAESLIEQFCCEGIDPGELVDARTDQAEAWLDVAASAEAGTLQVKRAIIDAARAAEPVAGLQATLAEFRSLGRAWATAAADAADQISVDSTRSGLLTEAAAALASLGWREEAVAEARRLATASERNDALAVVSTVLLDQTDLPGIAEYADGVPVAQVDTDNDGRPNFFNVAAPADAISASGLTLDDDQDGDGSPDTQDRYPLNPGLD